MMYDYVKCIMCLRDGASMLTAEQGKAMIFALANYSRRVYTYKLEHWMCEHPHIRVYEYTRVCVCACAPLLKMWETT